MFKYLRHHFRRTPDNWRVWDSLFNKLLFFCICILLPFYGLFALYGAGDSITNLMVGLGLLVFTTILLTWVSRIASRLESDYREEERGSHRKVLQMLGESLTGGR